LKHSTVAEGALALRRQIVRKLLRRLRNGGEERSHFGIAQVHVAETVLVDEEVRIVVDQRPRFHHAVGRTDD